MTTDSNASRQPLNTARVLEAAIAFADRNGVDALTMRKIADELGFGVMSLYNHVANKDEMLTGMVDVVAATIAPPSIGGDWRHAMKASALSAHDALIAHPWAASEWSVRIPGPARVRYMDSILRALTDANLSSSLVYHGYHAITMHIVGFTLQQIGYQRSLSGDLHDVASAFLDDMGGNHPHMAEHVHAHLSGEDHGDDFSFVLDLILDGLERANIEVPDLPTG